MRLIPPIHHSKLTEDERQARRLGFKHIPTNAEVAVVLWERIKAHRETVKEQGVLAGGKWFHSDDKSRTQQLGLVLMGTNVPPVPWKTMDGSFITMTQTLAGQIFQATATLDIQAHAVAEQHKAAVEASATPMSYDYRVGWPVTYTAI